MLDLDGTSTAGAEPDRHTALSGFEFRVQLERFSDQQTALESDDGLEHGFPFVEGSKWRKASVLPRPRGLAGPVFETGAASLYLPAFLELAAQAGFAPAPSRVTTGWTTDYPTEQWRCRQELHLHRSV